MPTNNTGAKPRPEAPRPAPPSPHVLRVGSRQRAFKPNTRQWRCLAGRFLEEILGNRPCDLDLQFLGPARMARVHQQHLAHAGPTDVITFAGAPEDSPRPRLTGEILICPQVAAEQATRFKTTPQDEVCRYFVHGVLHLLGHDDQDERARARMKREENRWMRRIRQWPEWTVWMRSEPPAADRHRPTAGRAGRRERP